MSELDRNLIADIIRLFEAEGLSELVVEEAGLRIAVRKEAETAPGPGAVPEGDAVAAQQPVAHPAGPAEPEDTEQVAIASPIAGVFYRSSSPAGRSYVREGDEVEEGQVVGIVEAMKVINEITSHLAGTVTRVVATNEELVAVGQVLMWIQPL